MIASRRRVKKDLSLNLFAGILKCADCGRTLNYNENRQGRTPLGFYICTKSREAFERCTYHYVRYDLLYDYVLSRLQHWITLVQSADPDLERRVVDLLSKKDNLSLKKSHAALNQAQKRKESLDHTFAKLYDDWANDRITEYNFNMLSQKYQTEQSELDAKIASLSAQTQEDQEAKTKNEAWVKLFKQYATPTELTPALLNALVKKIVVHEAVKDEEGHKIQKIDIFYRFIGKLDSLV